MAYIKREMEAIKADLKKIKEEKFLVEHGLTEEQVRKVGTYVINKNLNDPMNHYCHDDFYGTSRSLATALENRDHIYKRDINELKEEVEDLKVKLLFSNGLTILGFAIIGGVFFL